MGFSPGFQGPINSQLGIQVVSMESTLIVEGKSTAESQTDSGGHHE
jgi:hypothetical protein